MMTNTNKKARLTGLFQQLIPSVKEADFTGGIYSLLGSAELAAAARAVFPTCEVVDWSNDADFVACGTPCEVYVTAEELETAIAKAKAVR